MARRKAIVRCASSSWRTWRVTAFWPASTTCSSPPGSQQALDLIAKLLINRGDRILVESPTYLGALQAFDLMGAEYVTVPIDDDGLQTCDMEQALRSGPKFMYILPNFQNPGGVTLSRARRDQLVALCDKYGIPIIEDDPYGQLRYEGEHITPLVVLDRINVARDNGYKLGNVIYLSTFSKVLAPGLRVAWIVAPPDVIARLSQIKQSTDLHTSTFTQMVVYEAARDGFIEEHVKLIRKVYTERRDAMLQALARLLPAGGFLDSSRRADCSCGSRCRRASTHASCWIRRCGRTWPSFPAIHSSPTATPARTCG